MHFDSYIWSMYKRGRSGDEGSQLAKVKDIVHKKCDLSDGGMSMSRTWMIAK